MSFTSGDANSEVSVSLLLAANSKWLKGARPLHHFRFFSLFDWTQQSLKLLKQHLYQPVTTCLPDTLSLTFQGPRHQPG